MENAGTVLRQFYDAVRERDMVKARGYLADDMTFVGLFATYLSADSYIATFSQLLEIAKRLDVKVIIGEGNHAAVFFEMETSTPIQATTLVAEWHRTKDGKIVHVESAFDGRAFAPIFASAPDTPDDVN
jgi:ketosteroid isomerase-like protein